MAGIVFCFNRVGLYYKAFTRIISPKSLLIDSYQVYFFEKNQKLLRTGELGLALGEIVGGCVHLEECSLVLSCCTSSAMLQEIRAEKLAIKGEL